MCKWLIAAVALAAIGGAGFYAWHSPVLALKKLEKALADGDTPTLEVMVDWPRVREGLKESAIAAVRSKPGKTSASPFDEVFDALFGAAIVEKAVEAKIAEVVSPQGAVTFYKQADRSAYTATGRYIDFSNYNVAFDKEDMVATFGLVRDGLGWRVVRASVRDKPIGEAVKAIEAGGKTEWRVGTPAGQFWVGQAPGCKDDQCQSVVRIGDTVILTEDHITPLLAIPTLAAPEILLISSECGGSACGSSLSLLDVSRLPHVYIENFGRDIEGLKRGTKGFLDITGGSVAGRTMDADDLPVTFRYDRTRRVAYVVAKGRVDLGASIGKPPQAIFDANGIAPYLASVAAPDLAQLRERMAHGQNIKVVGSRFLVASGTKSPNPKDSEAGFVVVDMADGSNGPIPPIWSGWISEGKNVRIKRNQPVGNGPGSPRSVINDWLKQWGMELSN